MKPMNDPANHKYDSKDFIQMPNHLQDRIDNLVSELKFLNAELESRLEYSKNQMAAFMELYNENTKLKMKIEKLQK